MHGVGPRARRDRVGPHDLGRDRERKALLGEAVRGFSVAVICRMRRARICQCGRDRVPAVEDPRRRPDRRAARGFGLSAQSHGSSRAALPVRFAAVAAWRLAGRACRARAWCGLSCGGSLGYPRGRLVKACIMRAGSSVAKVLVKLSMPARTA